MFNRSWTKCITFFLPIVSESLPEKGLLIAAEMVKSVMIKPFLSAPPKEEMKSLSSGRIRLKLVKKKNSDSDKNQKFFPNVYAMSQKYVLKGIEHLFYIFVLSL